MPRKADEARLRALREVISTQPGHQAAYYARLLNCQRETISRTLLMLNDRSVLFAEDEQGRLWPFDRQGRI